MGAERIICREETLDPSVVRLHETLFSNANGYIGVRGAWEEGTPEGFPTMRGTYLNGVYETIPMKQAESLCHLVEQKQTMLNVADTQTITLTVDGEDFSLENGTVLENRRVLDMEKGVTERQIRWRSPRGKEIQILIRRMASFRVPELFTIEYSVTALNFSGEVALSSWHILDVRNYADPDDPRLAAESAPYLKVQKTGWEKSVSMAVSRTEKSQIQIASAVSHVVHVPDRAEISLDEGEGRTVYRVRASLKNGENLTLEKYTVFSDSIRQADPEGHAAEVLSRAKAAGLEPLYAQQEDYLSGFWHTSGMEILGDPDLDSAVRFNMYELLQSAPRDRYCSIAAKGLSGEGYEGHYFWDTEMFIAPFFILTSPELAKEILSYRYATLDKARENAALVGHGKGALYPWRTITGEECSGYFPSGTAAYHINGAIAYTVVQYYLTTGDERFILEQGEEILLETARLWMDTGNYDRQGRFVINDVTGPDEYTCMVDNNYYTNCSARYNLLWAVKLMERFLGTEEMKALRERLSVTEQELREMEEAARAVYLPHDPELGIDPQDDSFLQKPVWDLSATPKEKFPLLLHYHPLHLYRHQVCKQADTVLAHFLFPEERQADVMERSFRYYEKITTHDSSLSTCVFSMQASRLGLKKEALSYFGDSAKLDLLNTHNNTKDGVHTANMGGCYMAIVHGFAGLRITEDGMEIRPYLPEGWEGYHFNFRYRKNLIRLQADREKVSMELLEGDRAAFRYQGREYLLDRETGGSVDLGYSERRVVHG